MKKIISICLIFALLSALSFSTLAMRHDANEFKIKTATAKTEGFDVSAKAACLMEAKTGKILYSKNDNEIAAIASVTKIMSLLLVCEMIEAGACKLDDVVTISKYAASMGGSQVFLEEGERFTVEDLIKCTVIASANDAIVALAEFAAGSERAFVAKMNTRAKELGLKNTVFENTTGLDDTTIEHHSCAFDVAVVSRELIKHSIVLKYSSVWQDSIRDGAFVLTNTNRLVRYYDGCTGLKTGSTDKAGYCVSATAMRDGMHLIAVILGADSRDERNTDAKALLDYGFANFAVFEDAARVIENAPVYGGGVDFIPLYTDGYSCLVKKSTVNSVEIFYEIPEILYAPLKEQEVVGKVIYKIDDIQIGESTIFIKESVSKIGVWDLFFRIIKKMSLG